MTSNANVDVSRVPHLEARQRIAAAEDASQELERLKGDAVAPFRAERAQAQKDFDAAVAPFLQAVNAVRTSAFEREVAAGQLYDDQCEALNLQISAAEESAGETGLYDYDNVDYMRCCISGLVLFESDGTVEDSAGRKALVAVLPWPAFDADEEDGDEDDAEEAA